MSLFVDQSVECKLTVSTGSNVSRWEVGALVRSNIVTDGKTAWQLGFQRVTDADPSGVGKIECFLELVKTGEDGKPKFACILTPQKWSLPTLFEHTGQRSEPTTFEGQLDDGIQFTIEVRTGEKEALSTDRTEMVTDLISWFKQENFGDITLVAGDGKKFRCHRSFLAKKSEVFEQMFGHSPMDEEELLANKKIDDIIAINGYNGEIVQQLLLYVYLDHCEMGPTAERLMAAAQDYRIDRLKVLCEVGLTADRVFATGPNYNNLDQLKVVYKSVDTVNLSLSDLEKAYSVATMYHLEVLLTKARSLASDKDEVPLRVVARWKKRHLKSEQTGGEAVEKEMSQMKLN